MYWNVEIWGQLFVTNNSFTNTKEKKYIRSYAKQTSASEYGKTWITAKSTSSKFWTQLIQKQNNCSSNVVLVGLVFMLIKTRLGFLCKNFDFCKILTESIKKQQQPDFYSKVVLVKLDFWVANLTAMVAKYVV